MTQDPPENPFGEGGFDLGAMLEQAQQMQAQLMNAQAELAETTVAGSAGGLVSVTVSGTGELVGVEIKPDSFDASDAESLGDLSDLLVAAYRDAKGKADALAAQVLGPLAGGGLAGGAPGGLPESGPQDPDPPDGSGGHLV
ncbi:MAG: YbaB/EbfC family nucleoid-associated protein [Actinomycetota bacterium]|nr:YbaB/EbfC family nucleoid-associated protein [Actinomycetota bacterium]